MTRPLPTEPATVIDVMRVEDDGSHFRERFVLLEPEHEKDKPTWLSTYDRAGYQLPDDIDFTVVAEPVRPATLVSDGTWEVEHGTRDA